MFVVGRKNLLARGILANNIAFKSGLYLYPKAYVDLANVPDRRTAILSRWWEPGVLFAL